MKKLACFMMMLWVVVLIVACSVSIGFCSSVKLQWDPNTETNLSGYKVYFSNNSTNTNGKWVFKGYSTIKKVGLVAPKTDITLTGLSEVENWFFRVTAYNTYGVESGYSNQVKVLKGEANVIAPSTLFIKSLTVDNMNVRSMSVDTMTVGR